MYVICTHLVNIHFYNPVTHHPYFSARHQHRRQYPIILLDVESDFCKLPLGTLGTLLAPEVFNISPVPPNADLETSNVEAEHVVVKREAYSLPGSGTREHNSTNKYSRADYEITIPISPVFTKLHNARLAVLDGRNC